MKFQTEKRNTGFTILEVMIAIVIMGFLFAATLTAYKTYTKHQALGKDTELLVETLREARNLTIVSKNASAYGVHIDDAQIVLFTGTSYNAAAVTNKVYPLTNGIIATTTMPVGAADIVFNRITGETNQASTVTIQLINTNTSSSTIKIYRTGTVERSR